MKTPIAAKIILLLLTLGAIVLMSIAHGSIHIPVSELLNPENRPILELRLLRILVAALAGIGLSVSGIALQAILKNPLAEPYLLGTSSGAGLGAVIAINAGLYGIYLPAGAFLGAIATIIIVYNLAREGTRLPPQSLILSGIIVSVAFSGIMIFLVSVSRSEALHGILWWLWGNMHVYDPALLVFTGSVTLAGAITVYLFSQDLNAISLGEEEATHLGIRTETVKKILLLVTSLITASLVATCGIIGFVGLIIPHAMRVLVGANHKILIPCTCIASAAFMILSDMLSRTLISPAEIPIGIITAIIGAPVFIALLRYKQKIRQS